MRWFLIIPFLVIITTLSGCNQENVMDKFAPAENVEAAKNYIALLRAREFDRLEKEIDPNLKIPGIRENLVQMLALIPEQEPLSVKIVGAHISNNLMNGKASTVTNLTFEYQFPDKWLLINVITQKTEAGTFITNFHVSPMTDSLENINAFTLNGKTPLHYLILVLAILIPLFMIYALVRCAGTRMKKHKWLWMLFILSGIGNFTINWTTGQWGLQPLQIQLLGAGFVAPLFGPWMLSISLPIGAVIFLLRRKQLEQVEPLQAVQTEGKPG